MAAVRKSRFDFVRPLLYGRDVDRALKTRARIGLVIATFVLIYAVIGARLVMLAVMALVVFSGATLRFRRDLAPSRRQRHAAVDAGPDAGPDAARVTGPGRSGR